MPGKTQAYLRVALFSVWGAACVSGDGDGPTSDAATARALFSPDTVARFDLGLSEDAQATLDVDPDEYVAGSVRFGDAQFEDVGIRLKGHRSFQPLSRKAAFKLRFDKFVPEQRLLGRARITLNNMVEDPTFLRETLGYALYRTLDVPAPMTGYAEVYVNDVYYGLYLVVETVDEDFLADRFEDATGGLYEGEFGCDLYPDDVEGFDRDAGHDKERTALRNIAETVDSEGAQIFGDPEGPLETSEFLAYLAISQLIGDFDGYRHGHNYRIYHEPSRGKWLFFPWGIDRVFDRALDIYDSDGRLARLCFADHACQLAYLRAVEQAVDAFRAFGFEARMDVLAGLVDAPMRRDVRKPHGLQRCLRGSH